MNGEFDSVTTIIEITEFYVSITYINKKPSWQHDGCEYIKKKKSSE
jgi:hypothetical protein